MLDVFGNCSSCSCQKEDRYPNTVNDVAPCEDEATVILDQFGFFAGAHLSPTILSRTEGHKQHLHLRNEPGEHGLIVDNWGDCLQLVALVEGSAALRCLKKQAWANSFIIEVNGTADVQGMLEHLQTAKSVDMKLLYSDRLRATIPRKRGTLGVQFAYQDGRSSSVRLEAVSDEGDLAEFNRFFQIHELGSQTKPLEAQLSQILAGDFLVEANGAKGSAATIFEALQEAIAEQDVEQIEVVVLRPPRRGSGTSANGAASANIS